jgi:putative NADPH-quinone reductase
MIVISNQGIHRTAHVAGDVSVTSGAGETQTAMRISVILAHPDKGSFNHAIASVVLKQLERNGHGVSFHDLCAERFDPLLVCEEIPKEAVLPEPVKSHCEEVRQADGIIVIHPNWWGQPPAILKGWIDRVIRPGIAYEFLEGDSGEGVPKGLLKAEAAIVFNTSNTLLEREQQIFGDPLETIWRNCIFGLCGIGNFYRRTFSTVVTSTESERQEWLEEARTLIDRIFPKAERTAYPEDTDNES